MKDLKHLKHLPDGIFVCEEGVFKIVDGEVIELKESGGPDVIAHIGTIDDDPKNSGG